tara:strand:- start:601 stop:1302 length:702 start_codon:yes stop_codon:yes gene_type:complete
MKYFIYSKNIFSSTLFIFPLFILYEIIAFFKFQNTDFVIRNTADVIFRDFISIFTDNIILIQGLLIFFFFIYHLYNKNDSVYKFNLKFTFFMYIEGFLYGLLLIFLLNGLDIFERLNHLFYTDYILSFYLCLGAGIWEEILFRFFLMNILIYFLRYFIEKKIIILVLAISISSIIFSLFHYIGSFADSFNLYTFIIRYLGGVYLSILYYYRGLGIAMYSHFIYDFILVSYPLI